MDDIKNLDIIINADTKNRMVDIIIKFPDKKPFHYRGKLIAFKRLVEGGMQPLRPSMSDETYAKFMEVMQKILKHTQREFKLSLN